MSKRLFGYILGTAVTGTLCLITMQDLFVSAWSILFSFLVYALWYQFNMLQNDTILPKCGDQCYLVRDYGKGARVIFAHVIEVYYNENVESNILEMVVETNCTNKCYSFTEDNIGETLFFNHKDAVKAVERKERKV